MKNGISLKTGKKYRKKLAKDIVAIIEASPDREVAVTALGVYSQASSINNTTISGATITSNSYPLEFEDPEDEEYLDENDRGSYL